MQLELFDNHKFKVGDRIYFLGAPSLQGTITGIGDGAFPYRVTLDTGYSYLFEESDLTLLP